jgi:glucose/arabinose dehydrogenase
MSARLRILAVALLLVAVAPAIAADAPPGTDQQVGQQFHVTPESLPAPDATASVAEVSTPMTRGDHQPIVPPGFSVSLVMGDLPDPRRLAFGPDGKIYMSLQDPGDVIVLADTDTATSPITRLIGGLTQPYGLGFYAGGPNVGELVVGATDALRDVPVAKNGAIAVLSAADAFGPPKGHITRSVAIDPKTEDIYVGIGSMNNISDTEPPMKATIQKFDGSTNAMTTYATGMRNVTAMAFQPQTGDLYAVTMERDGMGDELVPDYLTRVQQGDNFGWPYQYIGGNAQPEYSAKGLKLAAAKVPDVLFAAHSAPLDLAFVPESWPAAYRGDAIVALHGSWNAGQPRGYKLVLVHFKDGRPDGSYENFMTGFWISGSAPAEVWGRPAALAFDRDGSLLVADDLGGTLWRVLPPKP